MSKDRERVCANCHATVTYGYRTKPAVCPYCGNQWWDKPRDEFLLFTLQDDYIKSNRDPKKLSLMYEGLIRYSENLIKKNLKGKTILSLERIHEQAEDTALNFLEVYLKKPDYVVESSFGGLLSRYVTGVMYNKREIINDKSISLDKTIAEDMKLEENVFRFMDTSPVKEKFEQNAYSEYESNHPEELLDELMDVIQSKASKILKHKTAVDSVLFVIGLRLFLLRNRKCSIDEFYDYYGDDLKTEIDDCLEIMKKILKNAR